MKAVNMVLNRLEEIIVTVSLTIAVILTFVEVILRYLFGSSLGFTHEVVVFLLIFTGLIGASLGVREKVHIGVDIVTKQFPETIQKGINIGTITLSALFCLIITILGYQHIGILMEFGQVTPELEIPLYIPKAVVPVAFGLMTIRFVQELIKSIKTPAEELQQEEGGHQ